MEEMIFEVADTHLFFNDLEVRGKCFWKAKFHVTELKLHSAVCEGCRASEPLCAETQQAAKSEAVLSTAESEVYPFVWDRHSADF